MENNPSITAEIDSITANADLDISVIRSNQNVGGFGRFYYAKKLAVIYKYDVFIDDDQVPDENVLTTLWREADPQTISGWWAYNFVTPRSYWLHLRAQRGQQATYIGTCGMIADSTIFKDERLFPCPKQFWFIEGLMAIIFCSPCAQMAPDSIIGQILVPA